MVLTSRCRLNALAGPVASLLLAAGLSCCGRPSQPPETDVPGYERLRDELGNFDFGPLAGRHIVLDPGHGGHFKGAIGLNGLTEAEVNLGVALYLRGLLEWAGAEVHLTRTADYDFLTPADSSLAMDLATRVAFTDSLRPDVFVSIHHNSNAALDRDLNETQTYYPVGREGADLDLARSIHKYLVRNLNIEPAKIMAGNFHVLRNASVPAVLGEPSMISNPAMERRLSLAAKQELEAQAYFLGLLEYFAAGTPRWVCNYGDTIVINADDPEDFSWRFDRGETSTFTLAPGLDPMSILLTLDGSRKPVSASPTGQDITWLPDEELSPGEHRLELTARNLAGRATPTWVVLVMAKAKPNYRTRIWVDGATDATDTQALFTWECRDRHGNSFRPDGRLFLHEKGETPTGDCELTTGPDGRGWLVMPYSEFPENPSLACQPPDRFPDLPWEAPVRPAHDFIPRGWTWKFLHLPDNWGYQVVVPGGSWRPRHHPALGELPTQYRELIDPTSPILLVRDDSPVWLEAAGALPLVGDDEHKPPWYSADSAPDTFFWQPVLPDLIHKVIILDPTGGGSETDGTCPLGTRGADLNLRVAEMTAVLLRGAGAAVILTRSDERWVPPEEKVLLGNERQADLFLIIGRSHDIDHRFTAHHHYGSKTGRYWARMFAQAVAPLLTAKTLATRPDVDIGREATTAADSLLIAPSYAYLLRHTACPALQVGLELPATMADEERLNDPSYQQAQARALFLGIAATLAGEEILDHQVHPGALIAQQLRTAPRDSLPLLEEIDWVKLDGNFPWLPPRWGDGDSDAVSSIQTPGLPGEADQHYLEIRTRAAWQLWALRPALEGDLEWKMLLNGSARPAERIVTDPAAEQTVPPLTSPPEGVHP